MDACDFAKLMQQQEALEEELLPYLESSSPIGLGGSMLRSPLVFSVPHFEQLNAFVNAQLRHKKKELAAMVRARKWSSAIFLHERPYRIDAFLELSPLMSDREYWSLASETYVDTENADQCYEGWRDVVTSNRGEKHCFMNNKEQALFAKLPDILTVYRGCTSPEIRDLSWTLSKNVAHWFANRFRSKGFVLKGKVRKQDILGYLTRRNEDEITVLPEFVFEVEHV